jgi:hypothetical protein
LINHYLTPSTGACDKEQFNFRVSAWGAFVDGASKKLFSEAGDPVKENLGDCREFRSTKIRTRNTPQGRRFGKETCELKNRA